MDTTTALFYVFSAVLLFAGFRVITARSPVHAALYLVLAFFNASCVWMLLQAEFLAISLVLVYVGAVMVLFLFVVMMLDINIDLLRQGFWKHFPVAGVVGAVIALEMAWVLQRGFQVATVKPMTNPNNLPNSKLLGVEIYTHYLYPLQIAAVLLLVGIIAAIALTLRRRKDVKGQNPGEQVRARAADRVRIVKMAPVIEAPSVAAPAADANASKGQA
ncbi:MAG: NADH-quinone oxidoreductase subunit J [Burkholderiales bacterium]|jgi:NADH-quinone oxidoreductase subunit J|nr:NADH-quinone oxidoreductase subunit J [Burkholderiales bacterium]MBP7519559.1 NADH-quinone oxidoreductase subunit J [Leptothrix sp. (in: b-proteobacteria)]HQY10136.1 NADH-quinone oxidoreductase subunit J [Burkholderiaceae bacterium]